jgi:hypothetical protein
VQGLSVGGEYTSSMVLLIDLHHGRIVDGKQNPHKIRAFRLHPLVKR